MWRIRSRWESSWAHLLALDDAAARQQVHRVLQLPDLVAENPYIVNVRRELQMRTREHPGDQPWNDSPADEDLPAGVVEPAPAEVIGDEDDDAEEDIAAPRIPNPIDKYIRETLDQRLAEEEPDQIGARRDHGGVELVDPRTSGGDVRPSEPDEWDGTAPAEDQPAEEAAIHVVDEDRIL